MRIRVVALPDERLEKISLEYSKRICDKYPGKFRLDDEHLAHATVFVEDFEDKDLEKLKKEDLEMPEGEFEFVKIGIAEDGEFGAVSKVIEEFNLN